MAESVEAGVNEVVLRGRVSAAGEERTLPSGDTLVAFRVIVARPVKERRRSKITVDTFDCTAWTAATQRAVRRLDAGDVVEVHGRLRRRFQRVAGMPTSRVDVDVLRCRKVAV